MSLENAPDEVKLAVDLIMLLENHEIPAETVLKALEAQALKSMIASALPIAPAITSFWVPGPLITPALLSTT